VRASLPTRLLAIQLTSPRSLPVTDRESRRHRPVKTTATEPTTAEATTAPSEARAELAILRSGREPASCRSRSVIDTVGANGPCRLVQRNRSLSSYDFLPNFRAFRQIVAAILVNAKAVLRMDFGHFDHLRHPGPLQPLPLQPGSPLRTAISPGTHSGTQDLCSRRR
jgi:hypothetical protein